MSLACAGQETRLDEGCGDNGVYGLAGHKASHLDDWGPYRKAGKSASDQHLSVIYHETSVLSAYSRVHTRFTDARTFHLALSHFILQYYSLPSPSHGPRQVREAITKEVPMVRSLRTILYPWPLQHPRYPASRLLCQPATLHCLPQATRRSSTGRSEMCHVLGAQSLPVMLISTFSMNSLNGTAASSGFMATPSARPLPREVGDGTGGGSQEI